MGAWSFAGASQVSSWSASWSFAGAFCRPRLDQCRQVVVLLVRLGFHHLEASSPTGMPIARKCELTIRELGRALADLIQTNSGLQSGLLGSEPNRLLVILQDNQFFKVFEWDCIQNFEVLQCVMQRWGSRDICIDDLALAIIKCDDMLNGLLLRANGGKPEINGCAKFEAGKLKRSLSLMNRREGRTQKSRHPKITGLKLLVTHGPKGKKRAADDMASGSDDISDDEDSEDGMRDGGDREDPGTPPAALKSESEKRTSIEIDSDEDFAGNSGASLSPWDRQACASSAGHEKPIPRPSQPCASSAGSEKPRPRPSQAPDAGELCLSQASFNSVYESGFSSDDISTSAKALPREDLEARAGTTH